MSMKTAPQLKTTVEAFQNALGTPTSLTPPVRYKQAYWELSGRSVMVYQNDAGRVIVVLSDYQFKSAGLALTIVTDGAEPGLTNLNDVLRRTLSGTCMLEGLP